MFGGAILSDRLAAKPAAASKYAAGNYAALVVTDGISPRILQDGLTPRCETAQADQEEPLPESVTGQVCIRPAGYEHDVWGTPSHLGDDAWGAAIMAIVRYFTIAMAKIEVGEAVGLEVVNLSMSFAVMLSNLAMQCGVLWYIWQYVVEPAVHSVQVTYHMFREHLLNPDQTLNLTLWERYHAKDDICEIAMVNQTFYYSILLLWMLTNMTEWRNIERLNRNLNRLPSVELLREQLHFPDSSLLQGYGECFIVGLTSPVRLACYILVVIPRLFIGLFLTWLGLRMLTSSASFSDMVLNSLALSFVISIDELLCEAVLPVATRKHLEETHLFMQDGFEPKKPCQLSATEWQGFERTVKLLAGSGIYLLLYGEVLQEVLPTEVRGLSVYCQSYITQMQQPLCNGFAYEASQNCYPAGHAGSRSAGKGHQRVRFLRGVVTPDAGASTAEPPGLGSGTLAMEDPLV